MPVDLGRNFVSGGWFYQSGNVVAGDESGVQNASPNEGVAVCVTPVLGKSTASLTSI